MNNLQIDLAPDTLQHFCQKWQITELSLFGSVLRDDFRPDSDIDVLATFSPDAPWSLLDLVNMEYELADLTGRDVDLIEKRVIEKSPNPIRKAEILQTAQVIYSQVEAYDPA
jgi:predicted nucleotidyltransferase